MSLEKYEKPPVLAIVDAQDGEPEDFEKFAEKYQTGKYEIAKLSLLYLCVTHEVHTPEELVVQPYPHGGPRAFLENSELFRFLPNFEELILKAVESNSEAAVIFLAWFAKHQFIQMEFYEIILDAALKTDEMDILRDDNLPKNLADYERNTSEEINDMKYAKAQIEELQATKDWNKLLGLPARYKFAASVNQQEIINALEKLIKHDERQLKRMKEFFAQNERKR